MITKLTQKDFESGIFFTECIWEYILSGFYAEEYENKKIPLSKKDIKEINILLEELNEFQKNEETWNREEFKNIFQKNEKKINFILDKYKFIKTKENLARIRNEIDT